MLGVPDKLRASDFLEYERYFRLKHGIKTKNKANSDIRTTEYTWNYESTGIPALVFRSNGVKHRERGPAVLLDPGPQITQKMKFGFEYWKYGFITRNDGPAVFYPWENYCDYYFAGEIIQK